MYSFPQLRDYDIKVTPSSTGELQYSQNTKGTDKNVKQGNSETPALWVVHRSAKKKNKAHMNT